MPSIRKRGDTYQITVCRGYDLYGRKLTESTTFRPDPSLTASEAAREAERFAWEFETSVMQGDIRMGRKMLLRDFAQRWMEEYVRPNLQPATVATYQRYLDFTILPALGGRRLTDLGPFLITQFYHSLMKDGARRDGKPGGYSISSIRKVHVVLSSMLQTAVYWELLNQNPCERVRLPTAPATADSMKFFTPEQTVAFLNFMEEPYQLEIRGHSRVDDTGIPYEVGDYSVCHTMSYQLQVLIHLAIYSGMRRGELLALQWPDIDFQSSTVRISKSLSVVDGRIYLKEPKTRSSIRTIALPACVMDKLAELKRQQDAYIAAVGSYWDNGNWVFTQENGRPMHPATPYHALRRMIGYYNDCHPEAPLPMIPFHGLRHTNATLMIANHQDVRTVANRLGHSQTSTTMNIYTHALQNVDRGAADGLSDMLHDLGQK